jgi:glycosyltransferase involved in cell wall biosynthesis
MAKLYRSVAMGPGFRLLRARALLRADEPGTTVVIVNFNSRTFLETSVAAVRHFGGPSTRILVLDNNSRDDSASWLRREPTVRSVLLRSNLGHGSAMDIGFVLARTEVVVALDVDAFPLTHEWLPTLHALLDDGAYVAGASQQPQATNYGRRYIHPCCLAMRRRDFLWDRLSFRPVDGHHDVGEAISLHAPDRLGPLDATSIRGPGAVGTVFGDVVYHNYYGTRFSATDADKIDWVQRDDPAAAWDEAVQKYLPDLFDDRR